MIDIDDVMRKLCDAGARAMGRYAEVSGEGPGDMPEYFMPAFILGQIGDEISVTLETGFSKLVEWNDDTRKRRDLPARSPEEQAKLLALADELGTPRVDMVLFAGQDQGVPKDEQDFLALVEFKRYSASPDDRAKLLRILPHIDTCLYGVVCGNIEDRHLQSHRAEAEKLGDRWYQSVLPGDFRWFFCARLFAASPLPGSSQENR